MTDLESKLAEIEALAKKATPGPWVVDESSNEEGTAISIRGSSPFSAFAEFVPFGEDEPYVVGAENSAAFIAASRTLVPALVAALRLAMDLLKNRTERCGKLSQSTMYPADDALVASIFAGDCAEVLSALEGKT